MLARAPILTPSALLMRRRRSLPAPVWSPLSLFAAGEQGGWYDPTDLTTIFQDSAGTTPVTAVEQPVGRLLDKSGRGNHLIQPTSASRPTYSRRYNLLERTQEFDNAAWAKTNASVTANAATAPDGTLTADKLVADATLGQHRINQNTTISATSHVYSVSAKAAEYNFAWVRIGSVGAVFDLSTGATSVVDAGVTATATAQADGWWRLSITCVAGANAVVRINAEPTAFPSDYSGNGVSGILIWGADLRRTIHTQMGMPAYQRVTTATDYDETGFLPRLRFDGADDSMYTASSVDFTATDEVTVLAGISKLSDAAQGCIAELTGDPINLNGIFILNAPQSTNEYFWRSRGTIVSSATVDSATYAAPITNVVTGLGKIASDVCTLRLNGAQVATSAGDQGTGNYSNAVLYIGRRNNASLPFNGDIFQLVVRGALTSGADLTSAEQYVAQRTGVTL